MTFNVESDRDRKVQPAASAAIDKGSLAASVGRFALYAVASFAALYAVTEPTAGAQSGYRSMSRGEEVARSLCSVCHQVAADQEYPPLLEQPTPSFTEIANRPGTSVRSLQQFITMTHWNEETIPMKMPNPMLTPEDTAAVAHYILSLRSHGKGVP
jgi:mono/diheme cytochrome c family protein